MLSLLRPATIILAMILLISCQKELSLDDGILAPPVSNTNCKSCTFQPWCQGSVYTYLDSTILGTATPSTTTINIVGDTTIDGKSFQKFTENGVSGYYNCTNGVVSVKVFNAGAGGANIIVTSTLFKPNDPAGTTWTDNNVNQQGLGFVYNSETISKGGTRVVLGVTYNDVMHVRFTTEMPVPIIGNMVISTTNSYYANNIGLIETTTMDEMMGTQMQKRVLQSYNIP